MRKVVIVGGMVLVVAGIGVGVWWFGQPKTSAEQFARAERVREKYLTGSFGPGEIEAERARVIATYRAVFEAFPAQGPDEEDPRDEAYLRIAEFHADPIDDPEGALEWYRRLLEDFPESEHAASVRWKVAGLLEKLGRFEEGAEAYLAILDADPEGARAAEALYRAAFLWDEKIAKHGHFPKAMELYERLLDEYAESEWVDDATFRLAVIYVKIREWGAARARLKAFIDMYPDSPHLEEAYFHLNDVYGELGEAEAQQENAEAIQEQFPDSPRMGEAREAARSAGEGKADAYRRERYGIPGADPMLERLIHTEEALHARIRDQGLDILRIDVEGSVDPAASRLAVAATLSIRNGPDPLREILLLLHERFEVTETVWEPAGGSGATMEGVGRSRKLLRLEFPSEWPAGAEGRLVVRYTGEGVEDLQLKLAETGFALSGAPWYPFTAYGDLFEGSVSLAAPEGTTVLSNGALAEPLSTDGGTTFRWTSGVPLFGLYLTYGPYRQTTLESGGRTFTYHALEDRPRVDEILAAVARILAFYEERFGPYRYEVLTVAETPLPPMLGGVGPASMLLLNPSAIPEGGVPEALLAHEIAHQWWGNRVPVSLDPGYSPWLNEGFATYADALYTEASEGAEAFRRHLDRYAFLYYDVLMAAGSRGDVPIRTGPFTSPAIYRGVVYEKGALALHALRGRIGDERFFAGLRAYAERYTDKVGTVEQFREVMEEAVGEDLGTFFHDWLDRPGLPRFLLEMDGVAEAEGDWSVSGTVVQEGDPYTIGVVVRFEGADGSIHDERLSIDEPREGFAWTLPFAPVRATIDPDGWVPKRPGRTNRWEAGAGEE